MKFSVLILIIFCISLVSCRKENCFDCFKSAGNPITEERELAPFRILYVNSPLKVYLTQDTIEKIIVTGGEHLVSSVEAEIKDSVLNITNYNKCNWVRSYKKSEITVELHFKSLDSLYFMGACDVYSTDTIFEDIMRIDFWGGVGTMDLTVRGKNLYFWPIGNGDFTLRGKMGYFFVNSSGIGNVHTENLRSNITFVSSNSLANCYVYAKHKLIVEIMKYNDVFYAGQPQIIEVIDSSGGGQLVALPFK